MTDATDDLELNGMIEHTYCQRHKEGKGLWPHECPMCIKERKAMKRKYILVTGGVYTDVTEKIEALLKATDDLADESDRCNSNDWNECASVDAVRLAIKELVGTQQ